MLINLRRTTNGFFGVSLIETFPISCGQNNRILFTCIYTHCKQYNQSYYPLYCSVVFCTIQYSLSHMFRKTFSSGWVFIMLVSKVQCQHCKNPKPGYRSLLTFFHNFHEIQSFFLKVYYSFSVCLNIFFLYLLLSF